MMYLAAYLAGVLTLPSLGFGLIVVHIAVKNWRQLR